MVSKRPHDWREEGFSLIELLVVMTLISILGTISMTAFRAYDRNQRHRGAVREIVAILRNTQVRSVTEAATYQCFFDTSTSPQTLKIYADSAVPPTSTAVSSYELPNYMTFRVSGDAHGVTHGFNLSGLPGPRCLFYARGSATAGIIGVTRIDNGREFDLKVEGLTARVSYG